MRLVRKFKNKPKAKKFRVKNGVKYQVLNIGGRELEVRVAGQAEREATKAEFAAFKKNPVKYIRKQNAE